MRIGMQFNRFLSSLSLSFSFLLFYQRIIQSMELVVGVNDSLTRARALDYRATLCDMTSYICKTHLTVCNGLRNATDTHRAYVCTCTCTSVRGHFRRIA